MANSSFVPSSSDLLLAVPRLGRNLAHLAKRILAIDSLDMANSTNANLSLASAAASSTVAPAASASASAAAAAHGSSFGIMSYLSMPFSADGVKGFGAMFSYIASRWAIATFVVVCSSPALADLGAVLTLT